jgi:alanyl-tRNA synthetase
VALANSDEGKVQIHLGINKSFAGDSLDASRIIRDAAKHVRGGGGGQAFYASAGGSDPAGLKKAFEEIRERVTSAITAS